MGRISGYFVTSTGKHGFRVYTTLCYLRHYHRYRYENKVHFCVKNHNEALQCKKVSQTFNE